ncbi:MAG: membrane protein insertion efficiency factor YidD [Betaproteobacteria bacterium]|jgi:hypothetical protein|nr:membrane protein insertion efficiency factor YidD [Betaproteobacteria bacterium]
MRFLLVALVRGYQLLFSSWVGGQCRFTPTCSQFAIEALREHGAARGSYLGALRIARCNPWCDGGHDPVPSVFHWAAWRRSNAPGTMNEATDFAAASKPAEPCSEPATPPAQDAVTPSQV